MIKYEGISQDQSGGQVSKHVVRSIDGTSYSTEVHNLPTNLYSSGKCLE